jgi:hypothetical protein
MKFCTLLFRCNRDESLVIWRTRNNLLHLHEKNTCWAALRGRFRDALLYMKEYEVRNSQILTGSAKHRDFMEKYIGRLAMKRRVQLPLPPTQQQELIDRSDVIHRAAMTERPSDELTQSALKGELMISFRATPGLSGLRSIHSALKKRSRPGFSSHHRGHCRKLPWHCRLYCRASQQPPIGI